MSANVYRLTDAGRGAWESQDAAVPADYRLVLWLIDFHGHAHVRTLVNRFPAHLLGDWMREMEELGLIEPIPEDAEDPEKALAPQPAPQEIEAASNSLLASGAYLAVGRLRGRRPISKRAADTVILIVEDDPDQLALADLRVTMAGYSVRVANSADAFIQTLAQKGPPDLLLLDVTLPDGDGFEILTKLRQHRRYGSLPVVMLTAKSEYEDIGKGLRLGADGYITKPYSKNILADVVRRVLETG